MKIIYVSCYTSDIVHFEGPPGSMVYWPDGYDHRVAGPPIWRPLEVVQDSWKPRTRILTVTGEVVEAEAQSAIQRAYDLLPEDAKKSKDGLLGVTLKDDPYEAEGKRWRLIGFFFIPSAQAWADLYDDGIVDSYDKAPEGWPETLP